MTKDDHPPEPPLPSSNAHQSEEACNGDYGTFSCSGLLDGWDYCLEDVWWSRFRQQPKRRGSGDNTENDLCRTVPTEYYSRHQMLKAESPAYILPPSSHGQKGAAPVYTYRPGTSTTQLQKSWPTRAHDGSMEQKNINRRESLGYSEGEST